MARPVREIAAVAVACVVGAAAGGLLGVMLAADARAATMPVWTAPAPADTSGHAPAAVSCPSESLCVAVDGGGEVWTTSDPAAAAPAWAGTPVDPGRALTGVSCPSSGLCMAVDGAGNVLYSASPGGGAGAWTPAPIDAGRALTGLSCASTTLCVAVDGAGNVVASVDAAHGTWGLPVDVDGANRLAAVSCGSPSLCVAVDGAGGAIASAEPAAGAGAWRRSPIDATPGLTAASCLGSGACVAVDGSGNALASQDPSAAAPTWSATRVDQAAAPSGVSCAEWGACVAVDGGGNGLASEDPLAGLPSWETQSVDPNTALAAVSCAASGLCLALDAQGRSLSTRLQMPAPPTPPQPQPVVHPRPAIAGTPAVGSLLDCLPGVSEETAQLSFEWLRDTLAIAGANGASYRVKGTDEGHYLQCRVTATNSGGKASATSAFVTIPFEGLPVASGETAVGTAVVRGGRVVVPVACSTKAPHGCRLLLRLTRKGGRGRESLLGARRARMGRGRRGLVSVALSPAGRRLLARAKRMAARLTVTGTVIGGVEALLAEQRLTLGARGSLATYVRGRAGGPAATPYMGWDTYFGFGQRYSESTVLEQASRLASLGLERRGYRYVWLDAGWWQGQRDAGGRIVVDGGQWPHGIGWLARTLHKAGFRLGLYTDAGVDGCGGAGEGSYGHYRQDADTFAAWGVDAVKVDFCGGSTLRLDPARAYGEFRQALESTPSKRPMLLSICDFLQPGEYGEGEPAIGESAFASYAFGPLVGNSWRTDGDVGVPGHVPFGNVLRNLDADAAHPQAAGPGHWNDPDYLGPDQGMGVQQFRTQASMWAMLAAPLMVSANLDRISAASLATLDDREAIAIDQDPAGIQGTLVYSEGNAQVWVKPLSDGSRALALLNRGKEPLRIETNAAAAGLEPARRYKLRDVWRHTTTTTPGPIAAEVPGDGTALVRVWPE